MNIRRLIAPAKVNLALLVGPLQPDGYHPIMSVMVPLELGDELEVELVALPTGGGRGAEIGRRGGRALGVSVTCAGVADGENLVDRALGLLEEESGWRLEGSVTIHKRIPVAAGLGGGSSDAATALRAGAAALETAGGPVLELHRLAELGFKLGADVPFFLTCGSQMACGRGERLESFPLPPLSLVLVLPKELLSTGAVYSEYDETVEIESGAEFAARAEGARVAWHSVQTEWVEGNLGEEDLLLRVAALAANDLEQAAVRMVPAVGRRRKDLEDAGALATLMSGSGPTIFGIFLNHAAAAQAAAELITRGHRAVVTRTRALSANPTVTLP